MIPLPLAQIADIVRGELAGVAGHVVARGVSTDTRTLQPGELFFAVRGARFDGHDFVAAALQGGACACVVERGFAAPAALPLVRVDDIVVALRDLAAAHRRMLGATVIAVTGSNGKTTTKSMLAHVLGAARRVRAASKSFNNHIGVPLTLLAADADDEYLIVEIGSNARGEVAYHAATADADVGMVTSVGPAHLAGFGDVAGVYGEKMSLFAHVRPGGLAAVNREVISSRDDLPRRGELRWITYGTAADADMRVAQIDGDLRATRALLDGRHALTLSAPGTHNAINACGVFAVCRALGLEADEITEAFRTFTLPAMRMNVRRSGAVTLLEDCYNANPSSMRAALDVLGRATGGRRVFIAGGMGELGLQSERLHRAVGEAARAAGVDVLVAIGPAAAAIADGFEGDGGISVYRCPDVADVARLLPDVLAAGDTILVKGSRAAGLERLTPVIESVFAEADSPPAAAGVHA